MNVLELAYDPSPNGWEKIFESCRNELFLISQKIENLENCFPRSEQIFRAFELTHIKNVKVVILGQDPYPKINHNKDGPVANGLSFSVNRGEEVPKSLINIFKEIKRDFGDSFTIPKHGNLTRWAKQGVLLINSSLTYNCKCKPDEQHFKRNIWTPFILRILKEVKKENPNVIFMLWGNSANEIFSKCNFKNANILASAHPSPLASGPSKLGKFSGNCHFSLCNKMLKENGEMEIDWNLD